MAGQDLDWDHSVGEDLLRREEHNGYSSAPYSGIDFFNGSTLNDSMMDQSNGVFLSQRQFAYLLRILGEANDLLVEQNHLKHHQMPVRPSHASGSQIRSQKCKAVFQFFVKCNLLITILIQALMLILVTIVDDVADSATSHQSKNHTNSSGIEENSSPNFWNSYAIMLSLTALNLLLVIYLSVRVTQNLMDSSATVFMLAQAYLSTVLVFASLYTTTCRMAPKSWTLHGFNTQRDEMDKTIEVSYLFLKMLFHSISTSTLCGSSVIHPDDWYNFILMAFQMLLSFVYFTSILSYAIGRIPESHSQQWKAPLTRTKRSTSLHSNGGLVTPNETTQLLNGDASIHSNYTGL